MATQYKDGSFGEVKALAEAIDEFNDALEAGVAKAFHVGTEAEIDVVKAEADIQEKLQNFESMLLLCESNTDAQRLIKKPSCEEIIKFGGEFPVLKTIIR